MLKKRLITDLSPSDCLHCIKRISKAAEPGCPVISIKEKYKNYFVPRTELNGRHIYSSVKDNSFEIYMTVWNPRSYKLRMFASIEEIEEMPKHKFQDTKEKFSRISGTVMENEEGGSIVQYQMLDHSLLNLLSSGIVILAIVSVYSALYFTPDASLVGLLVVYLMVLFPLSLLGYVFVDAYKCRKNLQSVLKDIVNAK